MATMNWTWPKAKSTVKPTAANGIGGDHDPGGMDFTKDPLTRQELVDV